MRHSSTQKRDGLLVSQALPRAADHSGMRWRPIIGLVTVAVAGCGSASHTDVHEAAAPQLQTCRDWLSWTAAQQASFTRRTVGTINLILRIRGETSVCWMAVYKNGVGSESAAEQLQSIASSWPTQYMSTSRGSPKRHNPMIPIAAWSGNRQRPTPPMRG
jgi:hypothetical protein